MKPRKPTSRFLSGKRGDQEIMQYYIRTAERKKKTKKLLTKSLYQAKLSFKNEGEIKTFTDKQKLGEFITPRTASREMLKGVIRVETKRC